MHPNVHPKALRSDHGFVGRLSLFLGLSALAGLLMAGLALPAAGSLGALARNSVHTFDSLPADLEIPDLPQRSRILDDAGNTIATFYFENRVVVDYDQIAPVMRQALVDIEDSRFYEHGGMDLRGTLRAFVSNQTDQSVQGGSTLTQQYVKNVLVERAHAAGDKEAAQQARARDYGRKLQELRYAIALEEKFSKDEILTRYLNIAYFGSGAYGVEAAARHYFSVPASKLTLPQAALLAGLVQSPVAYDPTRNPDRAKERRDVVLARMAQLGHITQSQLQQAQASPLGLKVSNTSNGCAVSPYPFFCDYVQAVILNDSTFGKTEQDRQELLRRGGITITTTLDPQVQKSAQKAIADHVYPTDKVAAALAMVQPGTGKVLALAQSRGFGTGKGKTQINYAVDPKYGGGAHRFQAGSTFKVFVAAAALKQGLPMNYPIDSPYQVEIGDVQACSGTLKDEWKPSNETRAEQGVYTMREALAKSVNTYFAQLEERTGVCEPAKIADAMGVRNADGSKLEQVKSFTLGVGDLSPLTMAEAYATFAARGLHCEAQAITKITDIDGKTIFAPKPKCNQAIPQEISDGVTSLLQSVMEPGGTGARLDIGRPAAGKTGTTNSRVAVWFDGFTPQLAAAVWAGNPDSSTYSMSNVTIGGKHYRDVCGGCLPGPIWEQAMKGALKGEPVQQFAKPDPKLLKGVQVTVPDVSGLSPDAAKKALAKVGLSAVVDRTPVGSNYPVGRVDSSSPRAGASIDSGTLVRLFVSGGVVSAPEPPPTQAPTTPPAPQPSASTPPPPPSGGGGPGGGPGPGNCKPKKDCPTPPPGQ